MEVTVAIICSNDVLIKNCLRSIPEHINILVVLNNPSNEVISIVNDDSRVSTIRYDELNLGYLRQLAVEILRPQGLFLSIQIVNLRKER